MNPLRRLWHAWLRWRRTNRFYQGYAFGMEQFEGKGLTPPEVARENARGWLSAAEHYGIYDAFDAGMRAALRDCDAKQRNLPEGAKLEQTP